jgi:hypothetical protein
MSITPVFANHLFGPEEVEMLTSAFDEAWATIQRSGSVFASPRYEHGAQDIIAKHIIELAKQGVRDRRELCAAAVAFLANCYSEDRPQT